MRALRAPLLVVATLVLGTAAATFGCKDEKMGAEKRAEEIASAKSAEEAAKKAAASQVDPAEQRYLERKKSLVQAVRDFKADEGRIMAKDPAAVSGILRKYFEPGPEGDKQAKALEDKRKKDGADGYRIQKIFSPNPPHKDEPDTAMNDKMDSAEVQFIEEAQAKGLSACLLYVQTWKFVNDKWLWSEQKQVQKVDCPS